MDASCGNCGYRWELQKDPADYKDGPRCPKCQNRNISIEDTPSDPEDVTLVFDRLEEGAELVDVVREEGLTPDEVEAHAKAYERLSDYQLLSSEELENHTTEAYETGYDEGHTEGYENGKQTGVQEGERQVREAELEPAKKSAYNRGRNDGYQAGYNDGKEAGRHEGYTTARKEFETQLAKVRDEIDNLGTGIDDRIEAAEKRGIETGKRMTAEQAWATGWEQGNRAALEPPDDDDMAAVYTEGVRHGIVIGIDKGIEVGKQTLANKFKALSG